MDRPSARDLAHAQSPAAFRTCQDDRRSGRRQGVAPGDRRPVIDRTDGVPLFIEELTKTVVESGILVAAGDRYAVTGPGTPLSIPSTLQGSLLARLDRLPATREVAQIGAALGRSFFHELVSAVVEMPQQKLDDALAQLVRAELMFRRGTPPDAEYTFKHALVQDAAYSTFPRSRRQQIHARIATTLETQFPAAEEEGQPLALQYPPISSSKGRHFLAPFRTCQSSAAGTR